MVTTGCWSARCNDLLWMINRAACDILDFKIFSHPPVSDDDQQNQNSFVWANLAQLLHTVIRTNFVRRGMKNKAVVMQMRGDVPRAMEAAWDVLCVR